MVSGGSDELLLPHQNGLSQLLVELDLLVSEAFHFVLVQLRPLEVLAREVVLHDLPLLGQLDAVLEPLLQLLVLVIEVLPSSRRDVSLTRLGTEPVVSDVEVGEELVHVLRAVRVATLGCTKARHLSSSYGALLTGPSLRL